jgi:hypothetical protein
LLTLPVVLEVAHLRCETLSEETFVALWKLRCSLIELKPDVKLDEDYASFRGFFSEPGARCSVLRDRDKTIHGFLGWYDRSTSVDGATVGVIDSDYFFMNPRYRGRPEMTHVALGPCARVALKHRARRVVIVGHGYPASVLSGSQFSSRVCFMQDGDVRPWERDAMRRFIDRFCPSSYDPRSGLVKMRTVPPRPARPPRSRGTRALLARFEQHNPRWTEGWGLPYLIHMTPGSIARGALGRVFS